MKTTLATILIGLALCVSAAAQLCQEFPSKHDSAALTSFQAKLRTPRFDHAVQAVILSGCNNGHNYIRVLLYAHPSKDVLNHIPKKYRGLSVVIQVWGEHPRID